MAPEGEGTEVVGHRLLFLANRGTRLIGIAEAPADLHCKCTTDLKVFNPPTITLVENPARCAEEGGTQNRAFTWYYYGN